MQNVKKVSAFATALHHKSGQPEMWVKTDKDRKEIEKYAERRFVQEGKTRLPNELPES
ncbi:hypothetical protein [Maribellus mangrovi]|uniref:hypothetical protein n=1 Tax=Maribellus mangrovi TaxID=3133146 RepID=UPI0030EDDCCF